MIGNHWTADDFDKYALTIRAETAHLNVPEGFVDEGIMLHTEIAARMRRDGAKTYGEWKGMVKRGLE